MNFYKNAGVLSAAITVALTSGVPANGSEVNGLKTVEAFEQIEQEADRSVALFNEMAKVIMHPRCMNCHPVNGGPLQGDAQRPHSPPVLSLIHI